MNEISVPLKKKGLGVSLVWLQELGSVPLKERFRSLMVLAHFGVRVIVKIIQR